MVTLRTRLMAGLSVPDSPLITKAFEYARRARGDVPNGERPQRQAAEKRGEHRAHCGDPVAKMQREQASPDDLVEKSRGS